MGKQGLQCERCIYYRIVTSRIAQAIAGKMSNYKYHRRRFWQSMIYHRDAFTAIGLPLKIENREGIRFLLRMYIPCIRLKRIEAKSIGWMHILVNFYFFLRWKELIHELGLKFGINLKYCMWMYLNNILSVVWYCCHRTRNMNISVPAPSMLLLDSTFDGKRQQCRSSNFGTSHLTFRIFDRRCMCLW